MLGPLLADENNAKSTFGRGEQYWTRSAFWSVHFSSDRSTSGIVLFILYDMRKEYELCLSCLVAVYCCC